MLNFTLSIKNFLSIKEANLKSERNITFIVAPNRAGKTQIMYFLYAFLWSLWKFQKEMENQREKESQRIADLFLKSFYAKLKDTFLIRDLKELISWGSNECEVALTFENMKPYVFYQGKERNISIDYDAISSIIKKISITKSPIYLSPAGLGDYYKGIWAIKKYYPRWKIVSEAITDLLNDLFILTSSEFRDEENLNKNLIDFFEKKFQAKFFIENDRIKIHERGKSYVIEKAASGLKSLSWLYLILKYNLLGEILFIDEPEVNLHPEYIDLLSEFIFKLSQTRKIKIFLSTHSDYLLESLNRFIMKENFSVDLWIGRLEGERAIYEGTIADKENLIDTSILNKTYISIVKELFGVE